MLIYAGIDEAGYGPMFGPLVIGRSVFILHDHPGQPPAPDLWKLLSSCVCKETSRNGGRLPINDSKKLYTPSAGLRHLEHSVLTLLATLGHRPATIRDWLDALGETAHRNLLALPWYLPTDDRPWEAIPLATTPGEIAVAKNALVTGLKNARVELVDMGLAVVFEDTFNRMVAQTRSKASMSFTFVSRHLCHIWEKWGDRHPVVSVDRQSGRSHYREPLSLAFAGARIAILQEGDAVSSYRIEAPGKSMTVSFIVDGDADHLPVALASMAAKYTREILMRRFNAYFQKHLCGTGIKPTAGYATDAKRFWNELQPHMEKLGLDPAVLVRAR